MVALYINHFYMITVTAVEDEDEEGVEASSEVKEGVVTAILKLLRPVMPARNKRQSHPLNQNKFEISTKIDNKQAGVTVAGEVALVLKEVDYLLVLLP